MEAIIDKRRSGTGSGSDFYGSVDYNPIVQYRVVDPDWFNTDPDTAFLLNPDPDPS
jgi:hypothetical protein